jgi:hypothetical protein
MPILYPIAFFAIASVYIADRLAICYFYSEPPQYDEKVTLRTLKYVKVTVICSLPFSYW